MGYKKNREAGHMMYVHPPSLARIREDLARFVRTASAPERIDPLTSLPTPPQG